MDTRGRDKSPGSRLPGNGSAGDIAADHPNDSPGGRRALSGSLCQPVMEGQPIMKHPAPGYESTLRRMYAAMLSDLMLRHHYLVLSWLTVILRLDLMLKGGELRYWTTYIHHVRRYLHTVPLCKGG